MENNNPVEETIVDDYEIKPWLSNSPGVVTLIGFDGTIIEPETEAMVCVNFTDQPLLGEFQR